MKSYLTSFATAEYDISAQMLIRSARLHGIDEIRQWGPGELHGTSFFAHHRKVFDAKRGAGFWLWKPFIIDRLLAEVSEGDIVAYSDAGISVVAPLTPLFELCRSNGGILVFAGHYDGIRGQPNICRVWTKRDCFVAMGCDSARYHESPMLDASFLVFARNDRSRSFVGRWLDFCSRPEVITDAENRCGEGNLPGYLDHRHDQSVLSLLAVHDGLEVFRSPSQFGNDSKVHSLREPGEWTRLPYGTHGVYFNSPYGTLLFHHRKPALSAEGEPGVDDCPAIARIAVDLLGVKERAVRFLEVDPDHAAIDSTWNHCTSHGRVDYAGRPSLKSEVAAQLRGVKFDIIAFHQSSSTCSIPSDLDTILRFDLLRTDRFVLCWTGLEGVGGWASFRSLLARIAQAFGGQNLFSHLGWVRDERESDEPRTVGIVGRR